MNFINIKEYEEGNYIVREAELSWHSNIWFKFPKTVRNELTERADPFIYACIFPMMIEGGNFKINGKVSKSVIKNIIKFNRIWNIIDPEIYKIISITTEVAADDYRPDNNKAVSTFSGGLDASYTAYKFAKKLDKDFQYDLDKSVMIWGADIPLSNKEDFELAFNNAKIMTDDLGIELVPVITNFRDDIYLSKKWGLCFGVVAVACLNFFSKNYRTGIIAGDEKINEYIYPNYTYVWGLGPVTDCYISSDTFNIVIDGYEHTRTERANFIKDWKVGIEHLRVCWSNTDKSQNCGCCAKCIRTKLNFMAVGVNHLPSMPNDLTAKDLCTTQLIQTEYDIAYLMDAYNFGCAHGTISPEIRKTLLRQVKGFRYRKLFKFYREKSSTSEKIVFYILGLKLSIKCKRK